MYQLDTGQKNLHMFFKDSQLKIQEYLWSIRPSRANSRKVWSRLQATLQESVSRASVITFLKDLAEKGILTEEKKSGKGGYHGIYYQKYSEVEFKQYLVGYVIRKLLIEFPEETRIAIETTP